MFLGDINIIKRLNNWDADDVGGVEISIKDFSKLQPVAQKNFRKPGRTTSVPIRLKENYPNIFTWLGLLDVNTRVLLVLMLIVGVINMGYGATNYDFRAHQHDWYA